MGSYQKEPLHKVLYTKLLLHSPFSLEMYVQFHKTYLPNCQYHFDHNSDNAYTMLFLVLICNLTVPSHSKYLLTSLIHHLLKLLPYPFSYVLDPNL